ncbi:N-6 DNA methylase, partial [bacterium]|nr:N-6 DNA methylase [bacterium]
MQQLFQPKVLNDFIDKQDEKLIELRWQKFKTFLAKKEKIASWIETDYQDGFLEDVFENALGYVSKTRSVNEHYTLEREKKNETNAQKADGALLVDGKVVAVIELKDQKTKDLDKKYNRDESAVRQAFGYLQHNNDAKYVIVSNFNELRFYFDKATAYEQFFLFDLDYEGFTKLHTILSYESISKNLPQTIKEKSLNFEQDISNKLYKDYTAFRTNLFENILKKNPQIDKLELLNATQKLIDRIVFILFGEDTDLLPKNTIGTIIARQSEVKKLVKTFTLYDSYKVYFEAINAGDEDLDITMYNGGLFAHDAFLDALIIDDEVLNARAKILSAYNFGSDISVNILGHIFENSISELEEMSAQILESDFDKKQSKRKKDGVFYTPAYITEYIVQNTLGKLCEDKRSELNITEVEAIINPQKPNKKELQTKENLLMYKNWLLNLKILDPACGSGAFLNQALEYLLKEHKRLQNDLALMGDLFAVYEVEKEVLEHNLYGVDINEGAVEIARLSLWLRTAKKGRPLTKLANKIKVGNSLISDKTVVPNAFDWYAEFPEVFAQAGFDVVIGNPPYGAKLSKEHQDFLKSKFNMNSSDTAILFVKMSFDILSSKGQLGFIIPKSFVFSSNYKDIRKYVWNNLTSLVDCKKVWTEVKLEQVMIILDKLTSTKEYDSNILKNQDILKLGVINKKISAKFGFFLNGISNIELSIANKMLEGSIFLNDVAENKRGFGLQQFIKSDAELNVIGGADIDRYM